MQSSRLLTLCGAALFCGGVSWAVSTQFWSTATFDDFSRGSLTGVSVAREGYLQLAPALGEVFDTEQAMVWAVARDAKGAVYLGTGHSGKVFRLGPELKGSLLFDAPEPDVFALALDKAGNVFVGTSPDGKIYKVDAAGNSQEFFAPQTKYIWSMAFGSDGALYVGTGDRGRIFRVQPDGRGELFYDTQQSHVMSLAVTPDHNLIAGTEPNGLLYRITPPGKGFVLYDAPLAEIHSVVMAADGSLYVSALGALDERQLRTTPVPVPSDQPPVRATTTITVRAADEPPMPGGDPGPGGQPDQQGPDGMAAPADLGAPAGVPRPAPRVTPGGGIRSAIYRVWPDSTVETLWSSSQESVFDVLPMPATDHLLFSTDQRGRIYEIKPDRQVSLLTQTDQEETTRLIPLDNFLLATTANLGKVFRLGTEPGATGSYESEVRDAGNTADWGQIRWTAEVPPGASLEFHTRSGNSRRPDPTWSDWSSPYRQAAGEPITNPPARYVQWKAVLQSAAGQSPVLREVVLAYLPRNRAPAISELRAMPRGERPSSGAGSSVASMTSGPGTVRVFSGAGSASRSAPQRGVDISWIASDPDQDELAYSLYFRGEGEQEWKLLQDELRQNYFQLDGQTLPDGKYRVKVVATDAGANPAGAAKTAEEVSAPFLVDATPPLVELLTTSRPGSAATARFRAFDQASVLTRAEYAVDSGPLKPLFSEDGIVDSREETFTVQVGELDDREHLLTFRVYDSAGNVGVGKAVWPALGPQGAASPASGAPASR